MHHIQKHITQILDGEAQPRYDSPELAGVLADTHAILGDRNAQQAPDGHPNSPAYGHLKLPHLN